MSEIFIKTENLSFSYETDDESLAIPAVDNVSLEIYKGEHLAILGHNGSGKSTFAKLLNFVLEPLSGKIFVDGKEITSPDITDDDIFELRSKVGMVFQNPDNQLVATIVEEDVAFGPENLGLKSEEIRTRVDNALKIVGMSDYIHHEPHRLSGGQKQRVAIAGVIAMKPSCMIFDESTAMLDPVGRREVMNTVQKLNKEENITVVNITHYMEEAAIADRIVILNDGKLFMQGTPDEIFSKEDELLSIGLDVPQSVALANKLKKAGIKLDGAITTPELCVETICKALKNNGGEN
jgi:energy-coupling factor transport system ATP-binding protein